MHKPPVELQILSDSSLPGEIPAHSVLDQMSPGLAIPKNIQSLIQRPAKSIRREVLEDETRSFPTRRVKVVDTVGESAGPPDDGDSPVFQAVHLVQAAGFIPRWHEEEITAGFDSMGQNLVVAIDKTGCTREVPGQAGEECFIARLSASQDDQLQPSVLQVLRERLFEKFKSFLPDQARDHPGSGDSGIVRESEFAEKLFLIGLLGPDRSLAGVVLSDMRVQFRGPVVIIDAVQNSCQTGGPLSQKMVQPGTVFGSLDLAAIGGAYGGQPISMKDSCFEEIDATLVQVFPVQTWMELSRQEQRGAVGTEDALVAEVVDGQESPRPFEEFIPE